MTYAIPIRGTKLALQPLLKQKRSAMVSHAERFLVNVANFCVECHDFHNITPPRYLAIGVHLHFWRCGLKRRQLL